MSSHIARPADSWQPVPVHQRPFAREIGDRRVWMLVFMRASALQGAHPVVAQGIVDHSRVWTDPTGRIPETIRYGLALYLGDDQAATAGEIRELHRGIGGHLDDGSRYHAWNRDVWLWVHLTTIEAILFALERCFGPLDESEVARFYDQSCGAASMYGIPGTALPGSVAELRRVVAEALPRLEESSATRKIHAFTEEQLSLLLPGPAVASRLLGIPLGGWLRALTYGTYPEVIRERWGIAWAARDERRARIALGVVRRLGALPERVRLLPQARAMLAR